MDGTVNMIIQTGLTITCISFGIGICMNMWINYSEDESKFPLFPILSPFSIASYNLMLNSVFKLKWKIENDNQNQKRNSNKVRFFSAITLLLTIVCGTIGQILN
jgi:hypothetical protein